MFFILILLAVFIFDQGLKDTIEQTKDDAFPKDVKGTDGKIRVFKNHNSGLPFGFLKDRQGIVKALPCAVMAVAAGFFAVLLPQRGYRAEKFGLAMILGGGISNLADRLRHGYVVDYLNVKLGRLKKVVFNVADLCVISGALAVVLSQAAEVLLARTKP